VRVRALEERFDAPTIRDQLNFHIVFAKVGQQVLDVVQHLVGTALAGFIKMENHTVSVHCYAPYVSLIGSVRAFLRNTTDRAWWM
jgi:hypothetical protein